MQYISHDCDRDSDRYDIGDWHDTRIEIMVGPIPIFTYDNNPNPKIQKPAWIFILISNPNSDFEPDANYTTRNKGCLDF